VLGEFNKNSAESYRKTFRSAASERLQTAHLHAYDDGLHRGHRGYAEQFDYSWSFINATTALNTPRLFVAGDAQHEQVLEMVKKYFGDWKRGDYLPQIR